MDHDAPAQGTARTHHDSPRDRSARGRATDRAATDRAAHDGASHDRAVRDRAVFTRTARVAGIVRRDPDLHAPGVAMLHAACMGA